MKVLLISHTCQSLTEGQPKAERLGGISGINLMVATPERWMHYGKWRGASRPPHPSYDLRIKSIRLAWLPGAQYYLHYYPGLRRLINEFKPDIIDLWEEPWGLVSAHACWLRSRLLPQCKIIAETEQNIDKTLPPPFESLRRYTLAKADHCIGRNRESVEIVRRKGFKGPSSIVPNAYDPNWFKPLDRTYCREIWQCKGFTAGYVGRLVEEKGILDFLHALSKTDASIRGLIAGDGPLRSLIEETASSLGIASRLQLVGEVEPKDLPTLMNAIDVLILPSRTTRRWKEQFGRVIIEAHGCATPVIGSDSGAIPEVIGEGGLVVPECNPGALATALTKLANDPKLVTTLGDYGRGDAVRQHTWQAVAERMHSIYSTLVSPDQRAPIPT